MSLHVYEWFSYACNNSSDHRLVAEFESPGRAAEMAKELADVFLANAQQADEAVEGGADWDPFDYDPSPALVAFAQKYGSEFTEGLIWGDDCFAEDLPEIALLGNKVYVYHGYMSGGFDGDLPEVLKNAGATTVEIQSGPAWFKISATAKAGAVSGLSAKIDDFTSQRKSKDNFSDWTSPWGVRIPSGRHVDKVVTTHTDDGSTFTIAVGADAIAPMVKWLEEAGAARVDVQLLGQDEVAALKQAPTTTGGETETFDPRGLSFLFTGKLASMTNEEATARVVALGGKNADSVSKALDVLVVGDDGSCLFGDGAKTEEVRQVEALTSEGAKIRVISESAFLAVGADGAG